jgi:hypothetical protein
MTSSLTQQKRKTDVLYLALTCSLLASGVAAEPGIVRFGPHIFNVEGRGFQGMASVAEVIARKGNRFQNVAKGLEDCQAVVAGPLSKARPRDTLRDTWTIIQSIRVECWALLQVPPEAGVAAAVLDDRITPRMIHRIMANSIKLASSNEEWSKALIRFPGGEITCRNTWRCRFSRPDGNDFPDYSMDIELILAAGDERFIEVTQMYEGRSGFVFGIHWHEAPGGGEVVAIFPDLFQ